MLNDTCNAEFILTQLNLRYRDLRSQSLGGNQKNLSLKIIKAYELIIPDIEQQQEFAAFAERAAKLEFAALVQYPYKFLFNGGCSHDNRRGKEKGR